MLTNLAAGRVVRTFTLVGLIIALIAGTVLAGGCGFGRDGPGETGDPGTGGGTGDPGTGGGASTIGFAYHPRPVISEGQNLLAFLGTDGTVYVWDGSSARPVYRPEDGHAVMNLAIAPAAAHPYLAVSEAPRTANDPPFTTPTRLTIINLGDGTHYRALPLDNSPSGSQAGPPAITTLQWSADGGELFVNGEAPVVLAIGAESATLAWDLAGVIPQGGEMREPLMAPDFSRLAFSLFEVVPDDTGEDLWIADRPLSGASAGAGGPTAVRRLTTGNLGGYPVRWLGDLPDGSDPGGRQTYVLVRLGAVSTGGGTSTGLAVVNAETGAMTTWFAEGNLVHRPVLIDLEGGWALIGLYHSITGRDGRAFWTPLRGGADEAAIPALDGYQVGGPAVLVDSGQGGQAGQTRQAVLIARDPETGSTAYWLVATDGSAQRLGAPSASEEAYLLEGTMGGRAFIMGVSSGPDGASRSALYQLIIEETRVEAVSLQAADD